MLPTDRIPTLSDIISADAIPVNPGVTTAPAAAAIGEPAAAPLTQAKPMGIPPVHLQFDVISDSQDIVVAMINMAATVGDVVSHFREVSGQDGSLTLVLGAAAAKDMNPLPFELRGAQEIASFVFQWLSRKPVYGAQPEGLRPRKAVRVSRPSLAEVLRVSPVYLKAA